MGQGGGKRVNSGWMLMCSAVEPIGFLMDLQGEGSKEFKVTSKIYKWQAGDCKRNKEFGFGLCSV